jgi:hypothetical protein
MQFISIIPEIKMDIRVPNYFLTVAREGNIAKAACVFSFIRPPFHVVSGHECRCIRPRMPLHPAINAGVSGQKPKAVNLINTC